MPFSLGDRSAVLAARHEVASRAIGALTFVSGAVVLASWTWHWQGLSRFHPLLGPMGRTAALCFVLIGAALMLARRPVTRVRRAGILALSLSAAAAGALALTGRSDLAAGVWDVQLPWASAHVFLAVGLALALIDVGGRVRPAEVLCVWAVGLALLALLAFLFGSFSVIAIAIGRPLALHSVVLMLAVSFGVLWARPDAGLMSFATAATGAGVLIRRMIPAVVVTPAVTGWAILEVQRAGLLPPALTLTMAYYAVAVVFVFAVLTWSIAATLHAVEVQRLSALQQVATLNAELEARVATRTAELEHANAELEAFTYSVSHDLRAPLRHIDGFAQMLLQRNLDALDETGRRHLKIICGGAQNMGRMIDDLLGLSRIERRAIALQPADLTAIVAGVIHELSAETHGRAIEWTCEPLPPMRCDPGLMKIVFTNLLSNAVKYTSRRPLARISVTARDNGNGYVFAIADNGAGFDPQYSDKLFGVFQRLHRVEDFEGTGIGLATVRRIIHKHGGRIWADAAVDRGATFSFTLGGSANLDGA